MVQRSSISGRSLVKRAFSSRQSPHVSFEFFPPKTTLEWQKLNQTAVSLTEFDPDFVSVTFGAGGSGNIHTIQTCLSIQKTMGVDLVPHLSCVGQTEGTVKIYLKQYANAGFTRILALRGDHPEGALSDSKVGTQEKEFRYAIDLVSFIKKHADFHIFVGCYPEGHPEATSIQKDIDHLIEKVETGADAAITQYFFNNASYFHFVEELRKRGLDTPIIIGLMPIWPYKQVLNFSKKCGADVPLWIRKRMEGYQDDPESQFKFAVEVATLQCEELLNNGAPGIHFYTLNRSEATTQICLNLWNQKTNQPSSPRATGNQVIRIPSGLP